MLFLTPKTCLGEPLKSGCLRLAEFCMMESVGLLVIFAIDFLMPYEETSSIGIASVFIAPVMALFNIIKIVCNGLLYAGAKKGNASLLKPWVWVYSAQTVVVALSAVGAALASVLFNAFHWELVAVAYLVLLVYCTACKYFCQVVRGLIFEIEQGNNVQPFDK